MEAHDSEDRFIRTLVILAGAGAALGVLVVATVVTVLVSANFNVLQWME